MSNRDAALQHTLCLLAALTLLPFLIITTAGADSQPAPTTLMISEVMPDAGRGVNDHRYEWVEIQNVSGGMLDLYGWSIEDDAISAPLPAITLKPGAFALIVGRTSLLSAPPGATLIILKTPRIGSGLRNAGDIVALVDPTGITRDAVSWGDRTRPYFFEAPKPNQSIIRDHRGLQGRAAKPTPFEADPLGQTPPRLPFPEQKPTNSAVQITAALVAPSGRDPLGEWITLRNVSDERVLMHQWELSSATSRIALPAGLIEPGETVLIASGIHRPGAPLPSDLLEHTDRVVILDGADGTIGAGLSSSGGHLILRDSNRLWLATASWGADTRFHRLDVPKIGQILWFSQTARVQPRIRLDTQRTPVIRIAGINLTRTESHIMLVSAASASVDLSGWRLASGGEQIDVGRGRIAPGQTLRLRQPSPLQSPLRLLAPDGSVAQTVPLPPTAGPAADAIALDRRLRSEPPRVQVGSETDVWISEIYPAAGMGRNDPAYEWFELANRSSEPVNLDGWTIADNHSEDALDGIVVPANDAVVIAAQDTRVTDADGTVDDSRIGNGLANNGDRLTLANAAGVMVDAVSWGTDQTYPTSDAPSPAQSINRTAPGAPARLAAPSPGRLIESTVEPETPNGAKAPAENHQTSDPLSSTSVTLHAPAPPAATTALTSPPPSVWIRITEIMPAPNVGEPEWVEIENFGEATIALDGWTLADEQSSLELSGELAPGERMTVASGELADADSSADVLSVRRIGNGLNDRGDTVILRDPSGITVDAVTYGSAAIPAPDRGFSIALDPASWVVNSEPTPSDAGVTALLADAFSPAPMRNLPADDGVPVLAASDAPDSALNPWLIVSAGLSGVILVLLLMRWRPSAAVDPEDAPETTTPSHSQPSKSDDVPPAAVDQPDP